MKLLAMMCALTYSNTDSVLLILERIKNKHGGNHGFFYIILWLRNFVLLIGDVDRSQRDVVK